MSASIAQRLAQLSVESAEERYEEAMEVAEASKEEGMESVSDMVEHAEKAEEVAEQLEELAEKAEEVADEDKAYLLNEVSTEAFSMVYANIMKTNNLQMAATSFESAQTHQEKMLGLAKDARGVVMHVRQYQDQVLDFSPEGKILSFIRQDKAKLDKAMAELRSDSLNNEQQENLKQNGAQITRQSIVKFLQKNGKPVTNFTDEVKADAAAILQGHKQVEDMLSTLEKFVKDDKAGATLPAVTFALEGKPLMGNRAFGTSGASSAVKSMNKSFLKSLGWAFLTSIGYGLVAGFATVIVFTIPGVAPAVRGSAAAMAAVGNATRAAQLTGAVKGAMRGVTKAEQATLNFDGYQSIVQELGKLENALNRDRFLEKVDSIRKAAAQMENKPEGLSATLGGLSKLYEGVYGHAFYLITNVADMFKTLK